MSAGTVRAIIISSDGHAMPRHPRDYRSYLPSKYVARFDEFCDYYDEHGYAPPSDPAHLRHRLDADVLEQWVRDVVDPGILEGISDPTKRLEIMERQGIVGEILFPDFGLPFEGPPPSRRFQGSTMPVPTREEAAEGLRTHNRWLADFVAAAPDRYCAMAMVAWDDLDATLNDIRWAREHGLAGLVLPMFSSELPLFHPKWDPVWSLLEELEMPANSHVAITYSVATVGYPNVLHPAAAIPLYGNEMRFRSNEVLSHLTWGGVLERHPRLRVAFTEQGSAWVLGAIGAMDYSYEGSYLRSDIREVLPHKPSEYFRRQCWLGSSVFSRAEIEARYEIGLDAMLLGMDYPHHEGTFAAGGTLAYLQATLGAAEVPADEAQMLLGENAIARWGLDGPGLRDAAASHGPALDVVLTPPGDNLFPRGDVHKPFASIVMGAGG